MKKISFITLILFLFAFLNQGLALDTIELISKLEAQYVCLDTIQMDFIQKTKVVTAGFPQGKTSYGVMFLKRTAKMRWDYKPPKNYHIISDGKIIWFYDEDEEQVMVGKLEGFLDKHLITSLFLDIKNIENFFHIKGEEDKDYFKLTLTPYEARPQLEKLFVWIKKKDLHIEKIRLIDLYGNINLIKFSNIIYDPPLKEDLFKFKPKEGVEVIHLPH